MSGQNRIILSENELSHESEEDLASELLNANEEAVRQSIDIEKGRETHKE